MASGQCLFVKRTLCLVLLLCFCVLICNARKVKNDEDDSSRLYFPDEVSYLREQAASTPVVKRQRQKHTGKTPTGRPGRPPRLQEVRVEDLPAGQTVDFEERETTNVMAAIVSPTKICSKTHARYKDGRCLRIIKIKQENKRSRYRPTRL